MPDGFLSGAFAFSVAARTVMSGSVLGGVHPRGDILISGHVLFPLSDGGLRPGLTTLVGLDYGF